MPERALKPWVNAGGCQESPDEWRSELGDRHPDASRLARMPEYRAHFDFDIRFANGGGLTGEAFRLDVPSAAISERELELLLVAHLGLALVGSVAIANLEIVQEQHRGSRARVSKPGVWGGAPQGDMDPAASENGEGELNS